MFPIRLRWWWYIKYILAYQQACIRDCPDPSPYILYTYPCKHCLSIFLVRPTALLALTFVLPPVLQLHANGSLMGLLQSIMHCKLLRMESLWEENPAACLKVTLHYSECQQSQGEMMAVAYQWESPGHAHNSWWGEGIGAAILANILAWSFHVCLGWLWAQFLPGLPHKLRSSYFIWGLFSIWNRDIPLLFTHILK